MKTLSLFFVIAMSLIGHAQHLNEHVNHAHQQPLLKSISASITNCEHDAIPTTGTIEANYVATAILYEFKLKNLSTSNTLTLSSTTNSISLSAFWSIITYSANYEVSVRIKYLDGEDPIYTEWSEKCLFSLGKPPKTFQIEGIECGAEIDINNPIYCTQIYTATCYTFYVTNTTTGQSANTGCISSNFFTLASLGITFNAGDAVNIYVSYTIGEEVVETTRECRYRIKGFSPFCETFTFEPTDDDTEMFTQRNGVNGSVGNHFMLFWEDHEVNSSLYYPTDFAAFDQDIWDVAAEVLADLDDFLFPNDHMDPLCSSGSARMWIKISPYRQEDIDYGTAINALAFAGQAIALTELDVNYLAQGCTSNPYPGSTQPYTPNVQLYMNHGGYGDEHVYVGWVLLNPATMNPFTNMNFNTSLQTPSFPGQFDLYTVILHEIIHILGFTNDDFKFQEFLHAYHSGSDEHLYNEGILNCDEGPNFNTLSTSTCQNVHYDGYLLTNHPIVAPTTYDVGTSLSHFPNLCGSTTTEYTMNPALPTNTSNRRCVSQNETYVLQDLGYNVNNGYGINNPNLSCAGLDNSGNSAYIIGVHDGLDVNGYKNDEGISCFDNAYAQISHCFDLFQGGPLILSPLNNDIDANFISEATVITGAANATVIIDGSETQLEFTATEPGLYTICYIPGRYATGGSIIERIGLPTFIQVWVPNCSNTTPPNLLCNSDPECSQICFNNTVYDHTLVRGTGYTDNTASTFWTPMNNGFIIKSSSAQFDNSGTLSPAYSSVFFWIDTDQNQEYSLSFERKFITSDATPNYNLYVYLAKSADMINGQVNQSGNNIPSIPASSQLVYQENFNSNILNWDWASICFNADDEYDMIFFYTEQQAVFSADVGQTSIRNLEFMQKEFAEGPLTINECMPYELNLGLPFCAVTSNEFEWYDVTNSTSLSSTQFYDAGNITSPLTNEYSFTMSYPALPATTVIPTENASCTESYNVNVEIIDCCPPGNAITHPLTCDAISRTHGEDVDADSNGDFYYTGSFASNISFGNHNLNENLASVADGFIAKFSNNCVEWLVAREDLVDSRIEVTDAGEVFWASRGSSGIPDKFQRVNPADGSPYLIDWQVQSGSYISDFKVNENNQEIVITGFASSGENYLGNAISTGIFVLLLDYSGTFLGAKTFSTNALFAYSMIAMNESNNDAFVAYLNDVQYTDPFINSCQWKIDQFDLSNLANPATNIATLDGEAAYYGSAIGPKIEFTSMEFDELTSKLYSQFQYKGDVTNSITLSNPNSYENMVIMSTQGSSSSSVLEEQTYAFSIGPSLPFTPANASTDLHIKGNELLYTNLTGIYPNILLTARSLNINTLSQNWISQSTGGGAPSGIKRTPIGNYLTGFFSNYVDVSQSGTIIYDNGATSFYGIKLDNSGNIAAMVIPNTDVVDYVGVDGGNKSAQSTAGVSENLNDAENPIKLYPNPTTGQFTITAEGYFSIQVQDLNGKVITTLSGTDKMDLDLSTVSSGIYLVKVQSETATQFVKLVKE